MAHLRQMQLDVSDRRALDNLRRLLHNTLREHDTLDLQTGGPLRHLLADLARRDCEEGLDGVGALAQVQKDHLAALCTRGLHTRAEEDSLTVHLGRKRGDLDASAPRAGLRLVEGQLAVEFGCIVLS